jgi:hypothetical protein
MQPRPASHQPQIYDFEDSLRKTSIYKKQAIICDAMPMLPTPEIQLNLIGVGYTQLLQAGRVKKNLQGEKSFSG